MREINLLRIKIKELDFILIDNESDEMSRNLDMTDGYRRLGNIKEIDYKYMKSVVESKNFEELNIDVYKNYYIIENDEIYSKEWLMSLRNSFVSYLLSKKIVIKHMITPFFLEDIKHDMEIVMKYPTFYLKINNPS